MYVAVKGGERAIENAQPGALARLEEERALAGLANGAGDEALGWVEAVHSRASPSVPGAARRGPGPPSSCATARALDR